MATLEHPASLNAYQQFRQANAILKETSRAVLPAWYQEALELDFQIHIRIDGTSVRTFFFNRPANEWGEAPPLSEAALKDPEQALAFGNQILRNTRALKGNSLGVVLHIADEFATAELKPELDNPAALSDLRETAFQTPGEILDDSSVPPEQASWRVMPYPASGSEVIGTTITLSRSLADFLSVLRVLGEEQNFPIITHALSAPLVAISGMPTLIQPSGEKPFVCLLQYPWFTVLAFFSEHSELRLIRTLQHRGMRRPSNFRNALATTSASLEFVDPDIYLMPLSLDADQRFAEDLARNFPESSVVTVSHEAVGTLPPEIPEPAFSILPPPPEDSPASHTFGILVRERWFHQDFLPCQKEIVELHPTRNEMRLLRYLRLARIGVAAVAVLGLAWLAFGVFSVIRRPEWAFNESEAKAVQQRLVNLTQERQRIDHWNNLLADRSKAWTCMEGLARLFPANSGLLLKTFNHTVRPDSAPGQAQVGFIKEWQITGMARDEALGYLNTLNTREGISAHFSEVSKVTGNLAYDPAPNTRTIVVNVRTQENSAFRQMPADQIIDSDDNTYPFTFSLTITQRFESADTLSISAAKAP
ncbi:hypothetical protein HZ994_16155 [Akkermansiaceae bacterium]|nr:hypothetical protein HZ994_16155 [Akkermansiaceae bacterium]